MGSERGRGQCCPGYDHLLEDDTVHTVGDLRLRTVHTPGHTPGSISFSLENTPMLFTGDTLFPEVRAHHVRRRRLRHPSSRRSKSDSFASFDQRHDELCPVTARPRRSAQSVLTSMSGVQRAGKSGQRRRAHSRLPSCTNAARNYVSARRSRKERRSFEASTLIVNGSEVHALMGRTARQSTLCERDHGTPGLQVTSGEILLRGENIATGTPRRTSSRGYLPRLSNIPRPISGVSGYSVLASGHRRAKGAIEELSARTFVSTWPNGWTPRPSIAPSRTHHQRRLLRW